MLRRSFLLGLGTITCVLLYPFPKAQAKLRLLIDGKEPTLQDPVLDSYLKFCQTNHWERMSYDPKGDACQWGENSPKLNKTRHHTEQCQAQLEKDRHTEPYKLKDENEDVRDTIKKAFDEHR